MYLLPCHRLALSWLTPCCRLMESLPTSAHIYTHLATVTSSFPLILMPYLICTRLLPVLRLS